MLYHVYLSPKLSSWCMGYTKRNKRCIPKEGLPHAHKACQKKRKREKMHTQRRCATHPQGVSKKRRKRKYSPYQKYYKGERNHIKEFHPPFTKNIHTLAHLDQGLWVVSPLDPVFDLAKYEKQVCHYILHTYRSTRKKPLEVGWKKKERRIQRPWWGMKYIEQSERSPKELTNFFSKTL